MPETMKSQNSCIALLSACCEAQQTMRQFVTVGFGQYAVAIICRTLLEREKTSARQNAEMVDDFHVHPCLQQINQAEALPQTGIFQVPDVGTLEVSGFLVNSFLRASQSGEQEDLSAVFSGLNIPADSQKNYAKALAHGQAIVIVRGTVNEVETAADLLATGKEVEVAVYQGISPD